MENFGGRNYDIKPLHVVLPAVALRGRGGAAALTQDHVNLGYIATSRPETAVDSCCP